MRLWLLILILVCFLPVSVARAQGTATPRPPVFIQSPVPGQALRGIVAIMGSTTVEGFQSFELLFGYTKDLTKTWFFIAEGTQPVIEGTLAEWDTTTLTDGNYTLRLVVYRLAGEPLEMEISDLRLRNYSPVETDTPAPTPTPTQTAPVEFPTSTPTTPPTDTPVPPTLTPLPPNSAVYTSKDITQNILRGALITGGAFLLLGLYIGIRKAIRK
jgi:hypothetical protein